MWDDIKEHFSRNYWLHTQAFYTIFMCILFSSITIGTGYLILLIAGVYSATIIFGMRNDTTERFSDWILPVILICVIPAIFGINFENNLVTMLLMIMFNNYYYQKHRIRAREYDTSINTYISDLYESPNEIKRKERSKKLDDLLDSDI